LGVSFIASQSTFGVSGMYLDSNLLPVFANVAPFGDGRVRGIFHDLSNTQSFMYLGMAVPPATSGGAVLDLMSYAGAKMTAGNATGLLNFIQQGSGLATVIGASLLIGSIAGAPWFGSQAARGLVIDVVRSNRSAYINARWTTATAIGWIPSAGMSATAVPVACSGLSNSALGNLDGIPFVLGYRNFGSPMISYFQADRMRSVAQPSEAYRLTSVTADTPLRSPITGSGPNVGLGGALHGPMPSITASSTGITAVDWQLDGGPMSDPMGVEVRVRERFTFAK
jgi:hypothetical protein